MRYDRGLLTNMDWKADAVVSLAWSRTCNHKIQEEAKKALVYSKSKFHEGNPEGTKHYVQQTDLKSGVKYWGSDRWQELNSGM